MRNWRWHKELSVWLTRDPNEQTEQGPGYERGVFYYFDPNRYEKAETPKDFVCHYDRLEDRPEWLNRQERAAQTTGQASAAQQQTTTVQQQQQTTGQTRSVQSLQSQGLPPSTSLQNQNQQQPVAQTS
jgi:CCR4-NOT transcription complex subunit 2